MCGFIPDVLPYYITSLLALGNTIHVDFTHYPGFPVVFSSMVFREFIAELVRKQLLLAGPYMYKLT